MKAARSCGDGGGLRSGAASDRIRCKYRQMINALVYQAIID
jgi:hypothetical protein